jgi:hypothetical protein
MSLVQSHRWDRVSGTRFRGAIVHGYFPKLWQQSGYKLLQSQNEQHRPRIFCSTVDPAISCYKLFSCHVLMFLLWFPGAEWQTITYWLWAEDTGVSSDSSLTCTFICLVFGMGTYRSGPHLLINFWPGTGGSFKNFYSMLWLSPEKTTANIHNWFHAVKILSAIGSLIYIMP